MKRYYLVTFSWTPGELSKVKEYKVFTNMEDPLREITDAHLIPRDAGIWTSEQINQIKRDECSVTFPCSNDIFKIVVTSDYPEKSKTWRHNSHNLIEVLCDTIIEAERDIKIDDILN